MPPQSPLPAWGLSPRLETILKIIINNRLKLFAYFSIISLTALSISLIFGDNYNPLEHRQPRGRVRRDVALEKQQQNRNKQQVSSSSSNLKDPFPNRPRIRTKNGHVFLESAKDKNIEFRTVGSRGTITINGHNIDQLLEVTKALERSSSNLTSSLDSSKGFASQYEFTLREMLTASSRLAELERELAKLRTKVKKVNKKLNRLNTNLPKRVQELEYARDNITIKLKRNDCVNPDTGEAICKNGATCLDNYDGFRCLCPQNWEGKTCESDVDECAKFGGTDLGCQNGAKCINYPGGYRCECTAQYHGVHCTDQHDDCAMSSSRSLCGNGKCINLVRQVPNQPSYECVCDQGWTTDGRNPACVIDINECLAGSNLIGPSASPNDSMSNLLLDGKQFVGSVPWSNSLLAAYPCSQNPFVECINLPGSFRCGSCPPGYTGNGRVCRDIDECATDNGGCSVAPRVECINTPGSRLCGACPAGYTGDGIYCVRMSPCLLEPYQGGCHPVAHCLELPGVSLNERLCSCPAPYIGDGVGPHGCFLSPSAFNQTSADQITNQTITTNLGQQGQVMITYQIEHDDCSPNPCLNDAHCSKTENSFECFCAYGFFGKLCQQRLTECGGGDFQVSQGQIKFPPPNTSPAELFPAYNLKQQKQDAVSRPSSENERVYCRWRVAVAQNMSVKLTLNQIFNEANSKSQILVYNPSEKGLKRSGKLSDGPQCNEYLEMREILEDSIPLDSGAHSGTGNNKRLMARFCIDTNYKPVGELEKRSKNDPAKSFLFDSNVVELVYSHLATTNQPPIELKLTFNISWEATEPPCGRWISNSDSGSISSPRFPEFYLPGTECRWFIEVENGFRIRIQFGELNLLMGKSQASECSDSLTILDGHIGQHRPILFKHCANNATLYSRLDKPPATIISSARIVEVVLYSRLDSEQPLMRAREKRGFYLTYVSEPASEATCSTGLFDTLSGIIKSTDYEPLGAEQQELQFKMWNITNSISDSRILRQLAQLILPKSIGFNANIGFKIDSSIKSSTTNSSLIEQWQPNYHVRCEYEIRPTRRQRDYKISIYLLEMPSERTTLSRLSSISGFSSYSQRKNDQWRRAQCNESRLTVYDFNPQSGTSRLPLAVFCHGDRYDALMKTFVPLVSQGHLLNLVYESTTMPNNFPLIGGQASNAPSQKPSGFKLKYSTICQATYRNLESSIDVYLQPDVSECLYHIVLPANNSISMIIRPRIFPPPKVILSDGSCAIKAILVDGALQLTGGGDALLMETERRMRTYNFKNVTQARHNAFKIEQQKQTDSLDGIDDDSSNTPTPLSNIRLGNDDTSSSSINNNSTNEQNESQDGYWQYSSSQAHDIKEFDLCGRESFNFDSIWNHVSLLFRLNAPPSSDRYDFGFGLTVVYQAQPSCGGIINDVRNGSFKLEYQKRPSNGKLKSSDSSFIKQTRFSQDYDTCSWILKASSDQVIKLNFDVPSEEISKRFKDWLHYDREVKEIVQPPPDKDDDRKQAATQKRYNVLDNKSFQEFDCGQVFREMVELYEPEVNRTRLLCPIDLIQLNKSTRDNAWTTQSSIVYIRLVHFNNNNDSSLNDTSNKIEFKQEPKALSGSILVKYEFIASDLDVKQCGGRLIQETGIINSPRYPLSYPPGANCEWLIQAAPGQQVRLNFTNFLIGDCADYLELRNGPARDSPLIGQFCANDLQSRIIVSHSRFVYMKFVSDGLIGFPGFELYFDGAQTGCGGRLLTESGQIDSPNYPNPSAHSSDCSWIIEASEPNKIELTLDDIDLRSFMQNQIFEYNSGNKCWTSGRDQSYLEIFDSLIETGNHMETLKSLGKFCSQNETNKRLKFKSTSNKLYLNYKSQALDKSRGFRATYKTICQNITLTGSKGAVESPGYPSGHFGGSLSCDYLIKGPMGSQLTLLVTNLAISGKTSKRATMLDYKGLERRLCVDNFVEIWPLYPGANVSNSSSIQKPPFVQVNTTSLRRKSLWMPSNGKLARSLCGSELNETERLIELDTNVAYINLESHYNYKNYGFRLEWRFKGCGQHVRVQRESNTQISYIEPKISSDNKTNMATECIWTFELVGAENAKTPQVIQFNLQSDLRSPGSFNPTGSSAKLDPCEEASLTLLDGTSENAPVITKNCDSLKNEHMLRASGTQALLKFYTRRNRPNNFNRGFTIHAWRSEYDACPPSQYDLNGPFNSEVGERKSPGYPEKYNSPTGFRCMSLLSTSAGSRLKIIINELDIPLEAPSVNSFDDKPAQLFNSICEKSNNYLSIGFPLRWKSQQDYMCGKLAQQDQPKMIIVDSAAVWMEFVAERELRGRWRFSIVRLCGSVVDIGGRPILQTPNYPAPPNWLSWRGTPAEENPQLTDNVCIWKLKDSSQGENGVERKIRLNIMDFVESPTNPTTDCLRVYEGVSLRLNQSHFNLTDIDLNMPAPKLKICKRSDITKTNLIYNSEGSEVIVLISGNVIASMRAGYFDSHCGGEFRLAKAEIGSPNFPDSYQGELDCFYRVLGSPGSQINLDFSYFNLPDGEEIDSTGIDLSGPKRAFKQQKQISCDNVDYVEIRQLTSVGKLRGKTKLVEKNYPSHATSNVKAKLVHAEQEQRMHLNSSLALNSTIKLIVENRVRLIELAKIYNFFADAQMNWSSDKNRATTSQSFDYHHMNQNLKLEDYFENSKLIGRFCGSKIKPITLQDEVMIRLRTHTKATSGDNNKKAQKLGFLLKYERREGGDIVIQGSDEELEAGGFIGSPMYPNMWQANDTITWRFQTKQGYVFQFDLVHMMLGSVHKECGLDYLRIADGLDPAKSIDLSTLCGHLSYNNIPVKDERSDWDRFVRLILIGRDEANNNSSKLPNLRATYKFNWSQLPVNSAFDPKVQAKLIRSVLTSGNVGSIVYSNRESEGVFLLRYKAVKKSETISGAMLNATLLEALSLPINEDEVLAERWAPSDVSGFAATTNYENKTKSCSQVFQLNLATVNESQVLLTSPNWPKEPPASVDCHWVIYTHEPTTIKLAIDPAGYGDQQENYYSTLSNDPDSCFDHHYKGPRNFIVVYDGATPLSPPIGRHCLPLPPTQFQSTGRHMLVRYVHSQSGPVTANGQQVASGGELSDFDKTRSLFRARASIGQCGGQYHIVGTGRVSDRPNQREKFYTNNLNCKYYVFSSSEDLVLMIYNELSTLDLAAEPTNANCTVGDYIEIRNLPLESEIMDDYSRWSEGRSLGRFCAGRELTYLEATGSAISIEFHTDSANVGKGFDLFLMSSRPRLNCPTSTIQLKPSQPYGRIMSPNWPHGFFGNRECRYLFQAPINSTIELTFIRLLRPIASDPQNDNSISEDYNNTGSNTNCLDKLQYIADNEALALQGVWVTPFIETKLPWNPRLNELMKDVPCSNSRMRGSGRLSPLARYHSNFLSKAPPVFDSLAKELLAEASNDGSTNQQSDGYWAKPMGYKSITLDNYLKLTGGSNSNNGRKPFTIKTDSSVLLLNYETKNLLPGEGFVALFKLSSERPPNSNCGGTVSPRKIGQNRKQDETAKSTDRSGSSSSSNLIQSALFNTQMLTSDAFVQCQYELDLIYSHETTELKRRLSFKYQARESDPESLGEFGQAIVVFNTVEMPPEVPEKSIFEKFEWFYEVSREKRITETCGLSRLILSDPYYHQALIACGNATQTKQYKWTTVDSNIKRLSIRTRNVAIAEKSPVFYRGVKGYLYEKSCLQVQRLVGEAFRFKSHRSFNASSSSGSSYEPGVCRWDIYLDPGDYEIEFAKLNFKPPSNYNSTEDKFAKLNKCDPNNPEVDYLEIRSSMESDAVILARYCIYNQAEMANQRRVKFTEGQNEMSIVFVTGISILSQGLQSYSVDSDQSNNNNNYNQLAIINGTTSQQFGFDMILERVKSQTRSEFCRSQMYSFIRGSSSEFYDLSPYSELISNPIPTNFLYPKDVHCEIDFTFAEDNMRYNFTFKGVFDMEQSKNCSNDYIQIDDLISAPDMSVETVPDKAAAEKNNNNNNNKKGVNNNDNKQTNSINGNSTRIISWAVGGPVAKRIGRWCGRTKPTGYFLSQSNKVRLTFHSDGQVSGKGFQLLYSLVPKNNSTNISTLL